MTWSSGLVCHSGGSEMCMTMVLITWKRCVTLHRAWKDTNSVRIRRASFHLSHTRCLTWSLLRSLQRYVVASNVSTSFNVSIVPEVLNKERSTGNLRWSLRIQMTSVSARHSMSAEPPNGTDRVSTTDSDSRSDDVSVTTSSEKTSRLSDLHWSEGRSINRQYHLSWCE